MARDDERAQLVERVNLQRQVEAKRAQAAPVDPNQPGPGAIGSNASPEVAQAQSKDWVDQLKELPGKAGAILEQSHNPIFKLMGLTQRPAVQHVVSKALDYPSGLARTALAAGAGAVMPGPNPVGVNDAMDALKGNAPGVGDYATRMGMPNPSVGIPFTNNKRVSAQDIANLVGNVATNPLMYGALRKMGEGAYDSGLKKIDEVMEKKGKTSFTDVMKENGTPAGSTKKIATANDAIIDQKMAERDSHYDQVRQAGVQIDPAVTPEANKLIAEMKKDPGLEEQAKSFEEHLAKYQKKGPSDIGDVSQWKSNLANTLPDSAYSKTGKKTSWGNRYQKALANDFRQGIVNAGESVEPGLGDKIEKVNDTLGTSIEAKAPLDKQVSRDNTKNAFTSVDAPLLVFKPLAAAAKKAADIAKGTVARTTVGKAMMSVPTDALRTGIVANPNSNQNPWSQK